MPRRRRRLACNTTPVSVRAEHGSCPARHSSSASEPQSAWPDARRCPDARLLHSEPSPFRTSGADAVSTREPEPVAVVVCAQPIMTCSEPRMFDSDVPKQGDGRGRTEAQQQEAPLQVRVRLTADAQGLTVRQPGTLG